MASKASKQNGYEVEMVLKIVRYLCQQGYPTEKMVVLTPYLGQLHKLQSRLKEDANVILGDLDKAEFRRAGIDDLLEKKNKRSLKISTIGMFFERLRLSVDLMKP